ncbi:MAG TPA: hypothetical protein VJ756_02970 [Terriglobales bacterium]|jgi:hypothetical protein|nr:hypothetical protein [Terriglobales bacterium]
MTLQPLTCPVCRRTATTRLLEEFSLTAEVKGNVREVNAVGAFKCEEEGHIFFVRFADIGWLVPAERASVKKLATETTSNTSLL